MPSFTNNTSTRPTQLYLKEILLAVILLGIIILGFSTFKTGCTPSEGFLTYLEKPLGQVRSVNGNPLVFYNCPEYRLPYNWPLGVKTEHPVEYIAPLKMGTV